MSEKRRRLDRTICIPFPENKYIEIVKDPNKFRKHIELIKAQHKEPFPPEIINGYRMKDIYCSKKLGLDVRRIEINGITYTVRPSFIMPYMTALVKDVEGPLLLRKYDVPFWVMAKLFGRNHMYWYRMERGLGRNSVVGTTIQKAEDLPQHLVADEKHTWAEGEKVYVACTVAKECILGVSVAENAGEEALTKSYGVFKGEALRMDPDYAPLTACTDGWASTQKAWKALFPMIALVTCFLHVFIKIRDGAKKKYKEVFQEIAPRLWSCYAAKTKAAFSQRVRRLREWGKKANIPSFLQERLEKLHQNRDNYSRAYKYPGAHRTSNMLDRLLRKMDQHLFNTGYFHGSLDCAERSLRGWALIKNFAPCAPETIKKYGGKLSPAERLNGFRYHDSWLQNLLVSASLRGCHAPPRKA